MSTYSESYWKRREEADAEREGGGEMVLPEMDFSGDEPPKAPELDVAESVPTAMPAMAVPDTVQTDAATESAQPRAAPTAAPPADDGLKAQRLKAIETMRTLGDASYEPPAGLRDSDISAASGRDRDAVRRANLSETLRAAFARQTPRLQQEPSEAQSLLEQRKLADSRNASQWSRKMTMNERLAAALREPKAVAPRGALTDYQRFEIERQNRLDAEAAARAKRKADGAAAKGESVAADLEASRKNFAGVLRAMGVDPTTASQKDIDRAVKMREAALGRSVTLGGREDSEAKDLAGKLGDPTVFNTQYERLMQLVEANGGRIPGAGTGEALKQWSDSKFGTQFSDAGGIEGRKLVKQIANNYIHAITGAGVSNAERDQLKSASADIDSNDDRQVLLGIKTLKDMYDAKVKATKAGYRPSVVERVAPEKPPASTGKTTPGGKPYKTRQVDTETGAVRYLDDKGNVIEQTQPSRPKASAPVEDQDDEEDEEIG